MKNLVFAFATLCAVTAIAAPPRLGDRIAELNLVVSDMLKPYQSNLTQAALQIKELTADDARVLTLRLLGDYRHVGKVQTIRGAITDLKLDYDMGRPVSAISGNVAFDFTKAFKQDQINQFVMGFSAGAEKMLKDKLKDYGDAVSVKAVMVSEFKDRKGDYTGFRSVITTKIDTAKLPGTLKLEDVAFLDATIELNAEAARGVMLKGQVNLNPAYKNYDMLKDKLEKLLARDGDTSKSFTNKFEQLNNFATGLSDTAAPRD